MRAIRPPALFVLAVLLAGCGSSGTPARSAVEIPRLTFGYASATPLGYVDRGRVNSSGDRVAVHDVSFRSESRRVDAYLVLPRGEGRRPAVVFVHGSGADRRELLDEARWLAARNVVTLTITEPSSSSTPAPAAGSAVAILRRVRRVQVRDVVAVRRAVDVLQSLPEVDPRRIGFVGWSAGAKTGAFVAASEPRVKALVLLSAGADPIATFVSIAPSKLRPLVRRVLGSVDPLRYIARARPGSIRLEDGARDEIVPHAALMNMIRAAPSGTTVRWYAAPHALGRAAYRDAFDWLARKLPIVTQRR